MPRQPTQDTPAESSSSRPQTGTSAQWNAAIGWSIYFPDATENDASCTGRARVVSLLKQFFCTDQGYKILSGIPYNSFALTLDFRQLVHRNSHSSLKGIAKSLRSEPELSISSLGLAACRAAEDYIASKEDFAQQHGYASVGQHTKLLPRIYNFEPHSAFRHLKGSSVGKFIAVKGTVVRVSTIRQQLVSMYFECGRCGETQFVAFSDYKYSVPTSCPTDRCRSRSFIPQKSTAESVDWQRIRIQELQQRHDDPSSTEEGRIPRTIDAELFSDLIDSCVPGDVATVCGIVKVMTIDGGGQPRNTKNLYYMYVEANSISTVRCKSGTLDTPGNTENRNDDNTPAVHEVIHKIVLEKDPFSFLVHSAVPSIYGHELVKAGLLLALFGGAQKLDNCRNGSSNDRVAIRRDIHCLVVGDPGLGKSQMLKAFCNIAPRGVYVCGNTSSTAGLTVTVVREPTGDFALEAGALVLGDGGICCIDEFDKMGAEHGALLEAMEQQSVSVAKAGLLCNLRARTTVLAAANPVGGHYDRSKTVCENLKIALPLLSRFDLVYILMDKADAARDRFISEHVMKTFGTRSDGRATGGSAAWRRTNTKGLADAGVTAAAAQATAVTQAEAAAVALDTQSGRVDDKQTLEERLCQMKVNDPLPPVLFRDYIAYARTHVNPSLTEGAKRVLQDFYLELRRAAHAQGADTTPITTRQLESMIRLSEARARAVMRTVVTASDARDVVEIMRACMVAEITDGSGLVDLGRSSGMSRSGEAKRFVRALGSEAQRIRSAIFTQADLKRIANGIGIEGDRFSNMIESVNNQGFLIMKGSRRWELQGSSFSQSGG